jgi:hypothetical protein
MNNEPLEREPIDRVRARLEALLKANAAPLATCGIVPATAQFPPPPAHFQRHSNRR